MLGGDLPTNPCFELDNRSKRSIVVDLGTTRAGALALELVTPQTCSSPHSRVRTPASRPRPETLRARNPRLVYATSPATGSEGAEADRPPTTSRLLARSGLARR